MWKDCNVVMLPTNEKSGIIWMNTIGQLTYTHVSGEYKEKYQPKHLYITSDEEIKVGDWYYNVVRKEIMQCENKIEEESNKLFPRYAKKIIATTDTSLLIGECEYCSKGYELDIKCMSHFFPNKDYARCQKDILPQPSQQFIQQWIEEYNKGNITNKVQVQYTDLYLSVNYTSSLIINTDNTINIKPIRDNDNRKEIIFLLNKMRFDLDKTGVISNESFVEWVENNI